MTTPSPSLRPSLSPHPSSSTSPSPSLSPSRSLSPFPSQPQSHTYDSSCRLRPISSHSRLRNHHHDDDEEDDNNDPPPPIQAQFFYASPIPIDDPLAAASTIVTTRS